MHVIQNNSHKSAELLVWRTTGPLVAEIFSLAEKIDDKTVSLIDKDWKNRKEKMGKWYKTCIHLMSQIGNILYERGWLKRTGH